MTSDSLALCDRQRSEDLAFDGRRHGSKLVPRPNCIDSVMVLLRRVRAT